MEKNKNLEVLLKNPRKTSNTIDLILKEIKAESIKIYDEVFQLPIGSDECSTGVGEKVFSIGRSLSKSQGKSIKSQGLL